MSEHSDYKMIETKLRDNMYQGNMHAALRDIGRIAGGLVASGRLSQDEADSLGRFAESMAINKAESRRKWASAVEFGKRQPLPKELLARPESGKGRAIGFDEVVNPLDYKIVNTEWLEPAEVSSPSEKEWNPCVQLETYLTTLFEPDEYVAFCTQPFERDGKFIPTKGSFEKVEKILARLKSHDDDGFEMAVGTPNPESGAWIVINPIDGKGRKDENITDFRYALIESDTKPVEEQVAIYRKLELPCACIVHSGGKSAHAIVRVNANSLEEYRKRVDFLYEVCANNGLPVDKQNRNPSRYSRMPGVVRGPNKQYLIDRNCGKASWDEWENWIKDLNDDLPDFEPLTSSLLTTDLPDYDPEIIEGILREGDHMIISGPPKAGKSFMLIDLAISLATGTKWLERQCTKGQVLYVNLELKRASCIRRFAAVIEEKHLSIPNGQLGVEIWHLRGKAMGIDKLAPKLIRRAQKKHFSAIIIDPAYQVFTGDENSAEDTGLFMRNLIKIAESCGSTVILCHHHSKGTQGDKRSMDRASGSGVFSRSPDTIIDLLPLDITDEARYQYSDLYEIEAMKRAAHEQDYTDDWETKMSEDDKLVANRLEGALAKIFDTEQMEAVREARRQVAEEFESVTGWRMSFTLRDFRSPKPVNLWFKYPCHIVDDSEVLKDCEAESESAKKAAWQKAKKKNQPKPSREIEFKNIVEFDPNEKWTVEKAMDKFKVSKRTIRYWIKKLGWATNGKNIVPTLPPIDEIDATDKESMEEYNVPF